MTFVHADRVADVSTTTGTGNVTVSVDPPSGFRTLATVLTEGDTFYYCIAAQLASEWEVGLGTYLGGNAFARTAVLDSSNSGSPVNFSVGTKDVFITTPAAARIGAAPAATLASAATVDIGASHATQILITGTDSISSFGGRPLQWRMVAFDDVLSLVHNATSLVLPTGADIETEAGDAAIFVSDSGGNWRCLSYSRASGVALDAIGTPPSTTVGNLVAWGGENGESLTDAGAPPFLRVRVVDVESGDPAGDYEDGDTIDGVELEAGDIILRASEGDPELNGVYVAPASGAASRHTAFATYDSLPGVYFSVMEGGVAAGHADTLWRCTSDRGGTINTDPVEISQFESGGAAEDITYDPTDSGLSATDVQGAVDELAGLPFYLPSNILGTVSQAGGVPTGSIVEHNSNTNGRYTRLADGTQWCWIGRVDLTRISGATVGDTWTFPAAFSASPVVTFSALDLGPASFREHSYRVIPGPSSAQLQLLQNGTWPDPTTIGVSAIAVGRWF